MATTSETALGRGGAWLGAAKAFFLLSAYAISIAVAHLAGKATFGRYAVVAALVSVPNMVLIQTLLFAVSRPMAEALAAGRPGYRTLRRRGFRIAVTLGGVVTVALLAGASWLAGFFGDVELADPVRIAAPICVFYALHAVNVGTLNARRLYGRQAALDVTMATTKSVLIVGAAAIGLQLGGLVAGFTAASCAIFVTSQIVVTRLPDPPAQGDPVEVAMHRETVSLLVYTGLANLLMAVDLLVLKHFRGAELELVGVYASAELVARVPPALIGAMSLLMFPFVASLHAQGDGRMTRVVARAFEVTLLLVVFLVTVGSACATDVQAVLFPKDFEVGSTVLRLLLWGFAGHALSTTAGWMLNSAKRHRGALLCVATPLGVFLVGAAWAVPRHGAVGAAAAVAVAGGTGVVVSLVVLDRVFGAQLRGIVGWGAALMIFAGHALGLAWPATELVGPRVWALAKLALVTLAVGAVGLVVARFTGLRFAAESEARATPREGPHAA